MVSFDIVSEIMQDSFHSIPLVYKQVGPERRGFLSGELQVLIVEEHMEWEMLLWPSLEKNDIL